MGSGPRSKYTRVTVELEQVRITLPHLIMDEGYSKDNMNVRIEKDNSLLSEVILYACYSLLCSI